MSALRKLLNQLRMLPPALAAATPGLGPWLARRRWPTARGTLTAPGLREPVEVIRDKWGVPHLYAKNEHDLFFAQGYVHAQDRLFQMELGRRLGDGTLSAAVGPAAVPMDRMVRTLGIRRNAERVLAQVTEEARAILDAYSEGVNARLAGPEPLPLELSILGITPAPWTPVDSLARGNILALSLSGNYRLELLRARLLTEAGEAITAALLPAHAPITPIIVPPETRTLPGLKGVAALEGLDGVDRVMGDPNIVSGSNNWVVHGDRTASGKPLLANDVHIGLGLPSTWYENGLHGGRFDTVGFTISGVPMNVLGHNGQVAWGMSNLGPDTQDFYLEKLDDPKAPKRYEFKGEWHELELLREEIQVKGGAPVPLEIRRTRHGPIMNEAMSRLLKDAEPMALRWTIDESGPIIDALVGMNLAKSGEEFRAALRFWELPGQNFVYADTKGNIGYQATGKIPIRAPGHQGLLPVPGWTGEYEWQRYIPFEELPHSVNPSQGYLATANNKCVSDDYPYLIAYNWFPGYRAKRITDLLAASDKHTVQSMRDIQAETYSIPAETLRPFILQAVKPADGLQQQALAELQSWDLRFETDRVGATVFQAWYIQVLRKLLGHKLGAALVERYLASEYERHGSMHMPTVISLMDEPGSEWWNDPKTPGRETRDDILRLCFTQAVEWLSGKYGPDPKGWQWGRVHTLTFIHPILGRSLKRLQRVFNTRTLPARGDNYSVDGSSFLWNQPFNVIHGTAQRMIIDLSDFSKSVGIHTPGQSEHLFHPHRDDLMELSQKVEFHPILFTRDAVEQHAEATLTLQPSRVG